MHMLTTPRGVLAVSADKDDLEKIKKSWPVKENLRISDWDDPKKRRTHVSRRQRRSDDLPA